MAVFTEAKRSRYLTLRETGRNVKQACEQTGVSRETVYAWLEDGRNGKSPEAIDFLAQHEQLLSAPHLDEEDLIVMLEASAGRGSVPAMKLLIEYKHGIWPPKPEAKTEKPVNLRDELAELRNARSA